MTLSSWLSAMFGKEVGDPEELGLAPPTLDRNPEDGPGPADLGTLDDFVLDGRYELQSLIAKGTTAAVYRAHDRVLEQDVAIKVLFFGAIEDQGEAGRISAALRDECRAAMSLSHPHILRVFNYHVSGSWEYVVMEHVVGEDLGGLVSYREVNRLTPEEVVRYGMQTLEGLQHAHSRGVIHNDLKPANLMLTEAGEIKVCDFGLARVSGLAWESAVAGTPAYMSPERIRGEAGDARSDLYSLGATLFALGNGHTLFGARPDQAFHGHLTLPPPSASHLPPAIHQVLLRALAKEPADRWADAAAMRRALDAASERPSIELPDVGDEFPSDGAARVARAAETGGPGRVVAVRGTPARPRALPVPTPEPLEALDEAALEPLDDTEEPETPAPPPVQDRGMVVAGRPVPSAASRVLNKREFTTEPYSPSSAPTARRGPSRVTKPAAPAPAVTEPPAPIPAVTEPPAPALRPLPEGMVRVPACALPVGRAGTVVQVPAFAMGRHPVTCAEYARYLDATGAKPPLDWKLQQECDHGGACPVVNITLEEAEAYARWRGARLPTEVEWLAAARGPDGRALPWGEEWSPDRCQGPSAGADAGRARGPGPVGAFPEGASPCGVEDLLGNVWEWITGDPIAEKGEPGRALVLGGSYRHAPFKAGAIARSSVSALKRYGYVGFRCVLDLEVS